MAERRLITKIKIAQKDLRLDEKKYREILAGYGVKSSTELSNSQAENLLKKFKSMGWKPKYKNKNPEEFQYGFGKEKYEYLQDRKGDFADPSELRKIEVKWRKIADDPSDRALMNFVRNKTKKSHLTFINTEEAKKLLIILKAMEKQSAGKQTF